MNKNTFLTIGPENSTGFRKHLEELSKLTKGGKFLAVKEKWAVATLPKIIKINPKLTIIGGRNWIKRNSKILSKIPGEKGILYTSPLAQAEISNEEISNLKVYFDWLDEGKIDYLFFSSKSLAEKFDRNDVYYLPAPSTSDLKLLEYKKKMPKIKRARKIILLFPIPESEFLFFLFKKFLLLLDSFLFFAKTIMKILLTDYFIATGPSNSIYETTSALTKSKSFVAFSI